MAYFSTFLILLTTTLCVNPQPVTFHYTRTHTGKVKSGRDSSPHHKSSLVKCAVQSGLKKLADQCFFYDVGNGACDAFSSPLLCNYRQLIEHTENNKKILFMVCRRGAVCKFTFVPGRGAVSTTKKDSFALSYDIYQVRFHQTLNNVYWTKQVYATEMISRIANGESGPRYHNRKMSSRVIAFDIDSSVNYMFIISDKALLKGDFPINEFETLADGRFYRDDRMFLDKDNRCTSRSRRDMMRVTYDGKLNTRIASILTRMNSFVVDDKGLYVFVCNRYLYRYNINTTTSIQLESVSTVMCYGMTSDEQHIYIPAREKILVLSMDTGTVTSTLHVATKNRKPGSYFPVILPGTN